MISEDLKNYIKEAVERPLSFEKAEAVFQIIMRGEATNAQIAGFLVALRCRGESVSEISAAATVLRSKSEKICAPKGAIDIVGTGGDGKGTLNISTSAAFVVAGAGVPVAKHGNKNLSSLSGAADILTSIGINTLVKPVTSQLMLNEIGICFMMAPLYHPTVKIVMPARQQLGIRTIFNIVGPLTNPARVKRQLTGAYDPHLLKPMAATLKNLGSDSAWLVHGYDGSDELSISGPSKVVELTNGNINEFEITPNDADLPIHDFSTILGGTPDQNAKKLKKVLKGEKNGYRDSVLLNSAAALYIAGRVSSLKEGTKLAEDSIDNGRAWAKLQQLVLACSKEKNE